MGRTWAFCRSKLLFTLSIVVTAAAFLPRLARPGAAGDAFLPLVCLPFVAIAAVAALPLAATHWVGWGGMIVVKGWLTCVRYVPLFAIASFAAIVYGLPAGAPTNDARAGGAAGLVAGGLSATACALSCVDDSLPSIALWYGLAIAICAGLGAKLGSRLLRW